MKKTLATSLAAAVVLSATALSLGPVAEAAAPTRTKVQLDDQPRYTPDGFVFTGTVSSPREGCEAGRNVVLRSADGEVRYGADVTNAKGKFKIQTSFESPFPEGGRFTATAARSTPGKLVCGADSDTIVFSD